MRGKKRQSKKCCFCYSTISAAELKHKYGLCSACYQTYLDWYKHTYWKLTVVDLIDSNSCLQSQLNDHYPVHS